MKPEHKKYILENIGKKSIKNIASDLHLKEKVVKRFLEKETHEIKNEKTVTAYVPEVIRNNAVRRKTNFLYIFLLIIIGWVAYNNSFSNQFIWDDKILIEENTHIESFSAIKHIFHEDLFHMQPSPTGYYRPIQTLSYMIDYFFWQKNPLGYHITSFILQILNTFAVFYLCILIFGEQRRSFFVASLFCIHPAFVPIVAYVSGRADLLGLFFALLSIFFILKYIINKKGKFKLAAGVILYSLAVISKEYYLITPLFLLLYLYIFKSELKIDRAIKITLSSILSVVIVYIFLRSTVLNFHQKMGVISTLPFLIRAVLFPYILTRYIGAMIFPVSLGMEYKLVWSSLAEPRFIFSYITPLLIITALYNSSKKREKTNIFFLSWFIVGIIPVSNLFIPLKSLYADHWMYMASIGFFSFLLSIADNSIRWIRNQAFSRTMRLVFPIAMIIFLIFLTRSENKYWKNEEIFYEKLLGKNTVSSRPKFNLGSVHEQKGDYKKALELYNSTIKEFSENPLYFYSRGMLYIKMNDLESARRDLETAVKMEPSYSMYRNNLGALYAQMGMMEEARAQWREALRLDPNNELARKNLDLSGEQ